MAKKNKQQQNDAVEHALIAQAPCGRCDYRNRYNERVSLWRGGVYVGLGIVAATIFVLTYAWWLYKLVRRAFAAPAPY
ncbi:MAG: hypothetical protein JST92_12860 [Deltaproteobacteria bacterium]|nr:hypothetical protein [Deltaproteobacteria bacterium]